ncbi:hypothetical protein CP971_33380 [Streptomyces viridifaciens]|nr:hypothetical protein CP971_33380 [Streptomyces viridifaciens]
MGRRGHRTDEAHCDGWRTDDGGLCGRRAVPALRFDARVSVVLAFGMGIGTTAVVVPGAFSAGEMTAITLRGPRRSLPQAHFTFDAWSITPIQ